jgi:hypothetical protein
VITSAGKRKPAKAEGTPTTGRRRQCRFIPPLSPISKLYRQRNSAIRPAQPDDTLIIGEIGQLETRLLELGDDYDARVIDRTEWLHRRGRLQDRLSGLRAQIATNTQHAVLDSVDLAGDWDSMGFDRKRAILAVVIRQVTLLPAIKGLNRFDPTKITITWTA